MVYKDDTKGIISLCPETFLPLYGHLLKNVLFKKRWLKIQGRKVLYPISCAFKLDVYGQLKARTLHIASSFKFSLCLSLWHIINSNKIPLAEIPTGPAQVPFSLFGFKQELYLLDHMRKQNPAYFLTLLQLTCATEAALCHLLLVKDPGAELCVIFAPAHYKLHFKASRAFTSVSHEETVLVHLEDTEIDVCTSTHWSKSLQFFKLSQCSVL